MRHKIFLRRSTTGEIDVLPFTESHYREVGVGYSPAVGMTQLEAFQLVNNWNATQERYTFWLQ